MGKKYLTVSFDDGLEQDKRIITMMKEYGIKGTFNLNAGMFGIRGEVKGIGNMAFADCPQGIKHKWPYTYTTHNRIPKDEIVQVYQDMEIASHSFMHESLGKIDELAMKDSLDRDIDELEKLTGDKIYGHAYAKGSTSDKVQEYLREKKIVYARNVFSTNKFEFPENPLNFNPTCSFLSKNIFKLIEKFKSLEARDKDMLFFVWGHGYEFDFGKGAGTWEHLERVFDAMRTGQEEIIFCTNKDAFLKKER